MLNGNVVYLVCDNIQNVVYVFLNLHLYILVGESDSDDENGPRDPDDMTLREEAKMIEEEIAYASKNGPPNGLNIDQNCMTGFDKVVHQNYPIICKTFTDPDSETTNVLLVISLPGGCDEVKIEVCDDGRGAVIRYFWPGSMYDVKDLFKKQLDQKTLTTQHAMIACFKAGLAESRKRIDFAPAASMKVSLPMQVQKVPGTWKKWGIIRDDGTQVLICVFSGLVTEYIITETDTPVTFGA